MAALVVVHLGVSPAVKMILDPESLSLSEHPGANAGAYTARLGEAPADEVTVTISPTASIAVDVDSAMPGNQHALTFTARNWNTPRMVAVTALPDDDAAAESATLAHSVPALGNVGEVSVTVADDDRGGRRFGRRARWRGPPASAACWGLRGRTCRSWPATRRQR